MASFFVVALPSRVTLRTKGFDGTERRYNRADATMRMRAISVRSASGLSGLCSR